MKKIKNNKHQGRHIPPLSLHAEELTLIAEVLSHGGSEVEIHTEEFEYDSINEFLTNTADKSSNIVFSRRSPYVSLNLKSNEENWLYCSSDDLISKGFFTELLSILEPQIRKSYKFNKRFILLSRWLGAVLCGLFIGMGSYKNILLIAIIFILGELFNFSSHKNIIKKEFRANQKNFWQRNSDQIIVAVIGALSGVLATVTILGINKP